uniref:Uncharacterized protein n=1 Tax=Leersia perrieri TaxID=77586 RepID=A0A0D9VEB1_9ORYZ
MGSHTRKWRRIGLRMRTRPSCPPRILEKPSRSNCGEGKLSIAGTRSGGSTVGWKEGDDPVVVDEETEEGRVAAVAAAGAEAAAGEGGGGAREGGREEGCGGRRRNISERRSSSSRSGCAIAEARRLEWSVGFRFAFFFFECGKCRTDAVRYCSRNGCQLLPLLSNGSLCNGHTPSK